jgi:hypothetical protein
VKPIYGKIRSPEGEARIEHEASSLRIVGRHATNTGTGKANIGDRSQQSTSEGEQENHNGHQFCHTLATLFLVLAPGGFTPVREGSNQRCDRDDSFTSSSAKGKYGNQSN